jgi:superfamily II DNA helicase RecQ
MSPDQVRGPTALCLLFLFNHGSLQLTNVKKRLLEGQIDLLYISPETLVASW